MSPGASTFATPSLLVMGLLLFLLGMRQLENGIRELGYATFKRWLSRSTSSPARSAGIGVITTALLQSSSLVTLLVLAFASAGVLPLYNAIGVILGANLGTTMTGWMVATIGFKLSLQTFALPMMAVGALLQLLSGRAPNLRATGIALFGLGLIIFGLDMMKDAVADLPQQWDISALSGHGPAVYFIAGTVVAALIQSSSATMMITLAALHGGLLGLPEAAAVVIGADLGTTSTTAIGSIGGHYVKRQLALAHVLFNVTVDLAAFFILLPLLPTLLSLLALEDPLYSLVAFHSLFNLLGLLLFLPLLKPYSRRVSRFFVEAQAPHPRLADVPTTVPEAALVATDSVLQDIRLNATALNLHAFHLSPEQLQLPVEALKELQGCVQQRETPEHRYLYIKELESEMLSFANRLQQQPLEPNDVALLESQVSQARGLVYASKTLNDIRENLLVLRHSDLAQVTDWYKSHRGFIRATYRDYLTLDSQAAMSTSGREKIKRMQQDNETHYRSADERVSGMTAHEAGAGTELSTMLNVNREIHHAVKNLLLSLEVSAPLQ